ncbi:protein SRC2 homolog isoform X1 [Vitis vinifera]|uniref:protein SRC2 homolog isoform X1 n=1 Tax=Vitis vinifera TaxID=29760 RepID=UPI00015C8FC7|nr:protein SRC2 homolog isoform X1 [Vitis vinifera]
MSISGIQGQLLEVTVVGCNKLKDTEWISRQDPYVCLEYGSTKFRTRTCTDGGKNPTFQEKFVFTLIEGLREVNAVVWNSNTLTYDDFIGSGKIQLQKVLSQGYDDTAWPLQTKTGRHAGEVRLILHYANARKPETSFAPSAPPYVAPPAPQVSLYSAPPPVTAGPYPSAATAYPATFPYPSYPPNSGAYPTSSYPPPQPSAYPPQPYPPHSAYPPAPYPPPSGYPPPPQASPYHPPGDFLFYLHLLLLSSHLQC